MSDTLIITNTHTEWPMGSLPSGSIKWRDWTSYWRSIDGDPDSQRLRGQLSGSRFSRVSTDEKLSVGLVLWLLSKVGGDTFVHPDGKEICIWMDRYNKSASIAIGGEMRSVDYTNPLDIEVLREWITASLEKNAKNFKGERK